MSNGLKLAVLLLLAVLCGGGFFVGTALLKSRALQQEAALRQATLATAEKKRLAADADAKAKAAAAKKAEAEKARAVAEREKAVAERESKKLEAANLAARQQAAKREAEAKAKAKAAAEAETARLAAETRKAEATRKELDAKRATEEVALKRATEERLKAEAERARVAAAQAVADAALRKSENELKTAQANAAAEHDRKLRMYRRAESSRAEMLELQRAERALALEEAGLSPASADEASVAVPVAEATPAAETNAAVAVAWPAADPPPTPTAAGLSQAEAARAARARDGVRRHARDYVATFGALIDRANREGRPQDAAHYSRMLMTFVPDYATTYMDLMDEARAAGRDEEATRACAALMALEPDWRRVGTMVRLLARNEAYYSRTLAGLVTKDEYVKAFRRLYDEARRSTADRDEREATMARLCSVLATYVPDFEKSSEWK